MAQLRDVHREFVKREAEVLAIAPDSPETLERFWTSHEMPFPGLCAVTPESSPQTPCEIVNGWLSRDQGAGWGAELRDWDGS